MKKGSDPARSLGQPADGRRGGGGALGSGGGARALYRCYTDGSCKAGVPGAPGGWGFVLLAPGKAAVEAYGSATHTVAKIMEHRAVAEALERVPERARVVVCSDNQPLVQALHRQLPVWRQNGFAGVDPSVVELVKRIGSAIVDRQLRVEWQWVRGHNGNEGNERADALAAQGARDAKARLARPSPHSP